MSAFAGAGARAAVRGHAHTQAPARRRSRVGTGRDDAPQTALRARPALVDGARTSSRRVVAPGAFFAVFPPCCGWARSTEPCSPVVLRHCPLITHVRNSRGRDTLEKSYGLHRLWSHFSRWYIASSQRRVACCWATSPLIDHYSRTGIVARFCFPTRASAGRRCGKLPAGHLLWGRIAV